MDAAFTRRLITLLAITVVVLTLFPTATRADELYGRVRGTVTDATGAVLPGVTLRIVNVATGVAKETTSGSTGSFEVINLIPGTYNITATKTGFASVQVTNITLLANQVYVAPVSMQVGTVNQEVTISANAAQVEQTSMQLTATITDRTITDLPLNGRNWVNLQQTLPGVVLPDTRFTTNFSTNGSQAQQNSYLINGTDYNDLPLNTPLAPPNPDAISEVRMITNTINPEYGRNSGAILNAVTKSGTNQFHGTAFEFFRDTSLNTHNFFQLHPSKFHQNQYGGTIGGPILKNRTFFFFSLQNTRNAVPSTNTTGTTTVFTPAQLGGDFSAKALSGTKTNPFPIMGENGTVFPVGTPWSTIFPTGHVPVSDFNPLAAGLVKQFVPLPNFGTNQFTWNPTNSGKVNQYIGRLDQNFGQKNALWFYAYANNSTNLDDAPFTGSTLPGFGQKSVATTKQFTTSWSHTFSTSMLNEVRAGYTRLNFQAVQPQKVIQPSAVGFPDIIPQIASGAQYPRISITGFFNLGFSSNGPQPRKDQTYQVTDNFSWVHGHHSLKFGYEGRKFQVWNPFGARNNGLFSFSTSARYSTGNAGLDFLLGIPSSYNQNAGALIIAQSYEHYGYAQDQWKVRDNLTLTLGTGYQIDQPIQEYQFGGLSRACFIPGVQSKIYPTAPLSYLFPGDPGCNKGGGPTTKYGHFGPRVGFAYSPNWGRLSGGAGKMSIRGGFGIYYNRGEEELNLQDLGSPPTGLSSNGISDISTAATPFAPSFPDPWRDIKTGTVLANKFPYTVPAPGTPFDFSNSLPFGVNVNDLNNTVPRTANFNLTVERELPGQTIFRLGYVGAISRHLVTSYTFNPVTPAGVAACLANPACSGDPENQATNFPNHFTFPGDIFGSSGMIHTNGTSNYNSMQVTVDKHMSHGLQFLGTYTWSHALDVGSSFEDIAFGVNGGGGFDPYGNLKRDYGDSAFDARHRFTLSWSYDVPNLNKWSAFSWLPSRIMGGWRLTGVNVFQTGQPIFFEDSNDNSLTCDLSFSFYTCPDRPDFVSQATALNPRKAKINGLNHMFFDPANFAENPLGTLGTLRRGSMHGPSFWNMDFALQKETKITERTSIQLRAEAFNLLNHTNFANPTGDIASGNFGRISNIRTSTNSRLVQLAAKFVF